jgi:hypothetical protein
MRTSTVPFFGFYQGEEHRLVVERWGASARFASLETLLQIIVRRNFDQKRQPTVPRRPWVLSGCTR